MTRKSVIVFILFAMIFGSGLNLAHADPDCLALTPSSSDSDKNFCRNELTQIEAQLDDIASFTELGDFLSLPMKTYSAGMSARLAFAISTAVHHDILLIDEGIGAGDASFQEKAFARIEGLFDRTPLVILASHSESLIDRFCNRRVTMERGRMVGDIDMSRASARVL